MTRFWTFLNKRPSEKYFSDGLLKHLYTILLSINIQLIPSLSFQKNKPQHILTKNNLQNLTINKPIDNYKNIQTTNQNETNMFFYIYT